MKDRTPEIGDLKPIEVQQDAIDLVLWLIQGIPYFKLGRGSGKSTARAMIANAILAEEEHPLYEVKPKDQS